MTPRPVWNPDIPDPIDHRAYWSTLPDEPFENGFLVQWEQFLRHVVADEPFPYDFMSGAKGVQLAEAGLQSWREKRFIELRRLAVDRGARVRHHDRYAASSAASRRFARAVRAERCAAACDRRRSAPPRTRIAYAAAHVVSDPRSPIDPDPRRRDRLGRDARVSPASVVARASPSPTRWTPRSAAWV